MDNRKELIFTGNRNFSTFRNYLIVSPSTNLEPYQIFSLENYEEIPLPNIGDSLHWGPQFETNESGILLHTSIMHKDEYDFYCFFVASTGKFLTNHENEGLFKSITFIDNLIIATITKEGDLYTYYFDTNGNLLVYTIQEESPVRFVKIRLYDKNNNPIFPESVIHDLDFVKDLEEPLILGLKLYTNQSYKNLVNDISYYYPLF